MKRTGYVTQRRVCLVYSELNMFMDCIVLVDEEDLDDAADVINEAIDQWHNEDSCECWGDVIERALRDDGISYEIYFKDEEEKQNV